MRNAEELKNSLKLYKRALGDERLKVKESKRETVREGQLRLLFWMPEEFVLVFKVEEGGLCHCVPMTVWKNLTTCNLTLYIKDQILSPLPFVVYVRREILEEESVVFSALKEETIQKILKSVERAPVWSANRYKREFIRLVWRRYEDITLSSIFYTHILREKQAEGTKRLVIPFSPSVVQKYLTHLQAYQLAAKTNALKGENWFGVVEEGKVVIYLPEEYEGKKIRIKFFEDVIYEGMASTEVVLENLPDLPSHEYLEEHLHVEVLEV